MEGAFQGFESRAASPGPRPGPCSRPVFVNVAVFSPRRVSLQWRRSARERARPPESPAWPPRPSARQRQPFGLSAVAAHGPLRCGAWRPRRPSARRAPPEVGCATPPDWWARPRGRSHGAGTLSPGSAPSRAPPAPQPGSAARALAAAKRLAVGRGCPGREAGGLQGPGSRPGRPPRKSVFTNTYSLQCRCEIFN